MFGLKPDDALHVMEHAAHVRRVFGQADAENEAEHRAALRRSQDAYDDATMTNMTAMLAIRSSQQEKLKLQQQAVKIKEIMDGRNDVIAANRSGTETINELIVQIAQLRDESTDVIRERVNKVRMAHYNKIVDDLAG